MKTKRVGVIALLHESNTFISQPTTIEHFRENILLQGEAVRQRMAGTHHEVSGFFEGLAREQFEAVPLFAARAVPYGPITAEAFDELLAMMFDSLNAAGPLDGILVAPHGATVCTAHRDADGYWLAELRRRVGQAIPIVGTLDAHANLSRQMIDATDALIAYRTNPHLDQRERGFEAAVLIARTIRGEVHPTQAAAFPTVAINIERQLTADSHLVPLYDLADSMLQQQAVLSNSVLLGFPYADVEEMGSSAIVVTDNDSVLASELAERLGDYVLTHRDDFVGDLIRIEQAIEQASMLTGPVCLLDMGDNVGGGSPADSTHLLHALARSNVSSAFVCLCDPTSVEQAVTAGIGSQIEMRVGGKTDAVHGEPFVADFEVVGIFDGKFEEHEPRHGGFTHCDQGLTAIVRTMRLTVMLTSRRMPPFSLQQLISCNVDPSHFQVLVAKGVNAPVAAYEPVCNHLIRVNTPGCTTADMRTLDFEHRRHPMFPFDEL
jgi:microcystin degradation protein MlrC